MLTLIVDFSTSRRDSATLDHHSVVAIRPIPYMVFCRKTSTRMAIDSIPGVEVSIQETY